jgi:hypothetical protein
MMPPGAAFEAIARELEAAMEHQMPQTVYMHVVGAHTHAIIQAARARREGARESLAQHLEAGGQLQ